MPAELEEQIKTHLHTFPERYKDVQEMQTEWKEFKARAMWTMVAFISSILAIGVWVGTMQSNVSYTKAEIERLEQKYPQVESRIGALEVNNSEIRSRLASIEVTLQEIKAAIIKLQ